MHKFTTVAAMIASVLFFLALNRAALAEYTHPDPTGILRKPIPDKLIVLTFDDAPASHATIVAPILKSLGFGGTMYVCDFDSFRTRKDWYLTYRQMKQMAADGFEIGNHTMGHGGSLGQILEMEDAVLAHGGPKMTTVCWPVYAAAPSIYGELVQNGYIFGRGGYERPYRPTVDHPMDVPSFTIKDSVTVEAFIKQAQQACQGRIVVYCFHGVPDMEHSGVSLEPATFKLMMQYLKDNNYHCIAMRDLTQHIDPVKASQLPQTRSQVAKESPYETVKDDKPYVPVQVETKPKIERVSNPIISSAKNILAFDFPGASSVALAGSAVEVYVPASADISAAAPTFKLSPLATAVPPSGTSRDFSKPQTYTITAEDGSTRVMTVSVAKGGARSFTWVGKGGNWSDAAHWSSNGNSAPSAGGKSDWALSFDKISDCSIANDFKGEFLLNRMTLGEAFEVLTLTGNGITFARNTDSGFMPVMTVGKNRRRVRFDLPITLASDLNVQTVNSGDPDSLIAFKGVVSGPGGFVLNSWGEPMTERLNNHDVHYGILQFENTNTYAGGTLINGGKINVMKENGLGTGPVTINDFGTLAANARISNAITINQGRLYDSTCQGPLTLNGVADFYGDCDLQGNVSGPGGFTMIGKMGTYLGIIPGGTVTLGGKCTYTGPTTVFPATLLVKKDVGLYGADPSKWTAKNITIHKTATLRLNAGGKDEFTGEQLGVLLKNLTKVSDNSGLMGGSWFCIDTAKADDAVVVSADFTDSAGSTGGPITFKKCGPGTVQLTGANSYSGRSYVENGTMRIVSFNSIKDRKPASSLGAPSTVEDGMIDLGGDCTLVYLGKGEETDRIIDLNGKIQTLTLDQSGSGRLKLTSPFDISGYGANKAIVLQGSADGTGELAGNISDPHDRKHAATTALVKAGSGAWTLSGTNDYSGATTVKQGTLILTNAHSLGSRTPVEIAVGAKLELNFIGEIHLSKLYLDGKVQPAGTYGKDNSPGFITGTGTVNVD